MSSSGAGDQSGFAEFEPKVDFSMETQNVRNTIGVLENFNTP